MKFKKKEEIIKLLQDKIRTTKANLFQANEQQNLKNLSIKNEKNDSGIDIDGVLSSGYVKNPNIINTNDYGSSNENFHTLQNYNNFQLEFKNKTNMKIPENCYDVDSSTCTTNTTSN